VISKFAITVQNINKTFQSIETNNQQFSNGQFIALNNISFNIPTNNICVLAGSNGAGKTILMSIIAGLESASSGLFLLNGSIAISFQDADSQILGETPREDIAFGPKNLKLSKKEINIVVDKALNDTGLSDKADFPSRSLSGGEKKRLVIAGILAMGTQIIVLDEPYANLDYISICQINRLIKELKEKGKTIIVLTHEIEKVLALADKFMVLHKGSLVFNGTSTEGLNCDLEKWHIKNPLNSYKKLEDLIWL
jgi:biotin transport system ATP-binding protein